MTSSVHLRLDKISDRNRLTQNLTKGTRYSCSRCINPGLTQMLFIYQKESPSLHELSETKVHSNLLLLHLLHWAKKRKIKAIYNIISQSYIWLTPHLIPLSFQQVSEFSLFLSENWRITFIYRIDSVEAIILHDLAKLLTVFLPSCLHVLLISWFSFHL